LSAAHGLSPWERLSSPPKTLACQGGRVLCRGAQLPGMPARRPAAACAWAGQPHACARLRALQRHCTPSLMRAMRRGSARATPLGGPAAAAQHPGVLAGATKRAAPPAAHRRRRRTSSSVGRPPMKAPTASPGAGSPAPSAPSASATCSAISRVGASTTTCADAGLGLDLHARRTHPRPAAPCGGPQRGWLAPKRPRAQARLHWLQGSAVTRVCAAMMGRRRAASEPLGAHARPGSGGRGGGRANSRQVCAWRGRPRRPPAARAGPGARAPRPRCRTRPSCPCRTWPARPGPRQRARAAPRPPAGAPRS